MKAFCIYGKSTIWSEVLITSEWFETQSKRVSICSAVSLIHVFTPTQREYFLRNGKLIPKAYATEKEILGMIDGSIKTQTDIQYVLNHYYDVGQLNISEIQRGQLLCEYETEGKPTYEEMKSFAVTLSSENNRDLRVEEIPINSFSSSSIFDTEQFVVYIKAKKVGDGQYGNARWVTEEEVKQKYMIVSNKKEKVAGFVVGLTPKGQWIVDTSDKNLLLLAPPGAGKTTAEIIPTIYYNSFVNLNTNGQGPSFLITDLKGEIVHLCGTFLEKCGYNISILDLRNPFKSMFFNLLNNTNRHMDAYLLATDQSEKLIAYGRAERYAKILAESIVKNIDVSSTSDAGNYFNETAQGLLTGIIFLVSEYSVRKEQRHLISVFNLIIELNGISENSTSEVQRNKLDELLEYIDNDRIKRHVGAAMSADIKTSMNVFSSALSKLVGLIDAELEQMITQHSQELNDIDFIRKPTAISIVCPDENPTHYFFASLFIRYFLNDLILQARESEKGCLDRQVFCIWDEFGNMPPIKDVDTLFSAARSAGIRIMPTLQSLAQLEKKYSPQTAKIIRETCQIMMSSYVAPLARETAEEILKILGNQTVQSGSVSTGGHGSQTVQMMAKPLMSPDDMINNLKFGDFIVMKSGCRPMRTKLRYYKDYLPQFDGYIRTQRNEARMIDKMTIDDVKNITKKKLVLSKGIFS